MCNSCNFEDPRDALAQADNAITGLQILLNQQPLGESIGAHYVAAVLGIIGDRMRPAVEAIQKYVPRNWTPPAG